MMDKGIAMAAPQKHRFTFGALLYFLVFYYVVLPTLFVIVVEDASDKYAGENTQHRNQECQ